MLKKYIHKNVTWIDIESPTKEDIKNLTSEYTIHPLIANELLSPTLRSRAEIYDTCAYFILHFPSIIHSHDGKTEQEIDFIVGKNFIITAHYEVVDSIRELSKLFEIDTLLKKKDIGGPARFLFFYILRHLYQESARELQSIGNTLTKIEEAIFRGREHEMVEKISLTSRKFLDFKRTIRPHQEVLDSFDLAGKKLFGEKFEYYLHAISGEYYRLAATLESNLDTLDELRATNNSLLNTKTNDTMKILAIMAFATFPSILLAQIFGMNTSYLPIVGTPNDFWVIIAIMVLATITFFVYFKLKKWL